jgi:hypothetical protein
MKKIIFLIWADAKNYQTLIFMAQFFSKEGKDVSIIHRESLNSTLGPIDFGRKTVLHSIQKLNNSFIDYCHFIIKYYICLLKLKPEYTFSFNKKAFVCASLLKFFFPKIKLIYHNFDYETYSKQPSLIEKIFSLLESKFAKLADLLIFPTIQRGQLFCKANKVSKNKQLIEFKNSFPKKYNPKISNKIKAIFKKKNFSYKTKIICRLGSIGPFHRIEELVQSVRHWNKNIILILAGADINGYTQYIQNIIKNFHLNSRVFIFNDVSNKFWFEILSKSHIGICFYEEIGISHNNMAGTSQKFNNYIFGNLPFLVNKNKDFLLFNKKYKFCSMVNSSKPQEIANKINNLIINKKKYISIKKKIRKAFLTDFNFDCQFINMKNYLINLNKKSPSDNLLIRK